LYLLGLHLFEKQPKSDTKNYTVPHATTSRFWIGYHRANDASDPLNSFPEMFDDSIALQSCSCNPADAKAPDGVTAHAGRCFSKDYEHRTFEHAKANCEAAGMKLAKFDSEDAFEQESVNPITNFILEKFERNGKSYNLENTNKIVP
jgi:hypothetical protein